MRASVGGAGGQIGQAREGVAMDFVKSQFDRIQTQIVALTPSQKMLTGSLVIILVMSLFYWTKYAATPELEPVLDQALSVEESGQIRDYLRAKGFDVRMAGEKVLVPVDRKLEAVAELGFAEKLPQNIVSGFDVIIKQMNPFDTASKTEVMWNQAKEITLGNLIKTWPGVAWANVVIDNTSKRGFLAGDTIKPSASVNVKMRSGARPDKRLAQAAVRLLTGSVAALDPAKVQVIIDGMPVNTGEGENGVGSADSFFALQKDQEKYYEERIVGLFPFMQAPVVARVSVKIDTRAVTAETTKVDAKNSLYKPIKENTVTDETQMSQGGGPEVGAGSNLQAGANGQASVGGMDAGGAGGERSTSNKTEERNEYALIPSQTTEKSSEGPGKGTIQSAAVLVPRSYIVKRYRVANPALPRDKEPDAVALQPLVDQEIAQRRADVKNSLGLVDDNVITVSLYDDLPPDPTAVAMAGVADAPAGVVSLAVGGHAKEIAVGALAVVSLFMVSMMVRKSAPAPVFVAPKVERPPPQPLEASELLAGEAGEGNPLLDGMELDDDAVKTQQMIGQVSQMVKDNPDAAANLVKRWMNRS
jgi:flagellar biosynthesis/type III secretory pathway M-ring protein FliF/YscJ